MINEITSSPLLIALFVWCLALPCILLKSREEEISKLKSTVKSLTERNERLVTSNTRLNQMLDETCKKAKETSIKLERLESTNKKLQEALSTTVSNLQGERKITSSIKEFINNL